MEYDRQQNVPLLESTEVADACTGLEAVAAAASTGAASAACCEECPFRLK